MIRVYWALLLLVLLPLTGAAQMADEVLATDAVAAYTRALDSADAEARLAGFRRAALLFEKLAERGARNVDVYTNLGNAALQTADLGRAVLAYRRALRLDPDHAQAQQNLAHARALLPIWVPRPEQGGLLDSFFFWHRAFSPAERLLAASVCFALGGLLLAASIRWRQAALRNLALGLGVAWLALLGSLLVERDTSGAAVVTAEEEVARAADSVLAASPFAAPLPGGTELDVIEERPPWLRVRLANGLDAWLRRGSVTRVLEGS